MPEFKPMAPGRMPSFLKPRSFESWVSDNATNLLASDFVAAAIEVNDTMEVARKILQGHTSKESEPSMGLIVEVCKMIFERERLKFADRQPVDE